MDCPACGHDTNKVISTVRWPTVDIRKHECLSCGYKFGSAMMLVELEAVLECAALVTRNWFRGRDSYKANKKCSALDQQKDGQQDVHQMLKAIMDDTKEIKEVIASHG